jgi:hypothetical protein
MFRRILQAVSLALVVAAPLSASAASTTGVAEVVAVESSRVTDIVLLGRGFDAGLRQGMMCRLTRGTTEIAEVLLVELRSTCSAALIVRLAPRQSIRPGDMAAIKVIKS